MKRLMEAADQRRAALLAAIGASVRKGRDMAG
jgi:hypothetical protein